ncbi:putative alpha-ketoglutarate-dependent dioxygenase [Trypanosoma conorhini]|uniref:Putative alpha-ketoglutarate-dependent dioxygenase n=1 Tax=Trypanosoma conorhini TaxID=83891 RepID=A0A3S5IUM2_9TRYP|nr:putative alpha-ketoglutarate-dependent dioxygenase [Trypanosoma conorhini]RNF26738.1 putative alpha-ketoglutarate-dependent dioxygenase [Trypanosoma conorhini]
MPPIEVPSSATTNESPKWASSLLRQRLATRGEFRNEASQCAAAILRSEAARADGQLCDDVGAVLAGNAVYIRRFVCDEEDTQMYDRLKAELVAATGASMSSDGGRIDWSRHEIFENPTGISATFNDVVAMLAEYFDVDVYATRLNYYRDGQQWKPQHHDSHAYGSHTTATGERLREDFTVGITLGATRSLLFVHEASGRRFDFPQRNGDCFAFTGEVNTTFTHGVPRVNALIGDRFSIIAWGRRRAMNARNGGRAATSCDVRLKEGGDVRTVDDAILAAHQLVSRAYASAKPAVAPSLLMRANARNGNDHKGGTSDDGGVPAKKKKKNRLQ